MEADDDRTSQQDGIGLRRREEQHGAEQQGSSKQDIERHACQHQGAAPVVPPPGSKGDLMGDKDRSHAVE
ncbi:hypothetical protein CRT23_19160 [Methylobacterium sp. V23]|nr:hypothetical protein CRT23_19160 [Methylobacterium sp. V23]